MEMEEIEIVRWWCSFEVSRHERNGLHHHVGVNGVSVMVSVLPPRRFLSSCIDVELMSHGEYQIRRLLSSAKKPDGGMAPDASRSNQMVRRQRPLSFSASHHSWQHEVDKVSIDFDQDGRTRKVWMLLLQASYDRTYAALVGCSLPVMNRVYLSPPSTPHMHASS